MTHPNTPFSGHEDMDKVGQRQGNWHTIQPVEVPLLEELGHVVRTLRIEAGLTLKQAGELAELHHLSWMKIEAGVRRTRLSTLERMAAVLAPRVGLDPEALVRHFIVTGSIAIAPEMGQRTRRSVDA